ncbi:MAG: NifB/NifX family molybdenum-iron cluster-binding protein [Desulfohalobiaceae bacterium]|nr:NifB/NifX family molybdenum-iron cluster-binding protein [Desulfohalobiaceae bacterium]
MKVAISSTGGTFQDQLDPRFGRAAGFIIFDLSSSQAEFIDNQGNQQASKGAGIHAAQNVARAGAEAVITGHIGPKAYAALESGKIEVYHSETKTVREVVEDFRQGRLSRAQGADSAPHWQG